MPILEEKWFQQFDDWNSFGRCWTAWATKACWLSNAPPQARLSMSIMLHWRGRDLKVSWLRVTGPLGSIISDPRMIALVGSVSASLITAARLSRLWTGVWVTKTLSWDWIELIGSLSHKRLWWYVCQWLRREWLLCRSTCYPIAGYARDIEILD